MIHNYVLNFLLMSLYKTSFYWFYVELHVHHLITWDQVVHVHGGGKLISRVRDEIDEFSFVQLHGGVQCTCVSCNDLIRCSGHPQGIIEDK